MNTEVGFNTMEKLLPYVSAILSDDSIRAVKVRIQKNENDVNTNEALNTLLPLFIGKHRDNMYVIASIICEKTVEEIKEQPLTETISVLRNGIANEMLAFFGLCLRMAMNA